MNLLRRALVVTTILISLLSLFWYVMVWINGGGRYLVANVILICLSSLVFFALSYTKWGFAKWVAANLRSWLEFWFILGFSLAVLLLPLKGMADISVSESLLFTAWPGYLILLVPFAHFEILALVFLVFSFVVNGVVYGAGSFIVWWVMHLLPQISGNRELDKIV
ncbi:MAG: hypothetical protein WBL63_19765 [Candidatus Acidiferrum sp.]